MSGERRANSEWSKQLVEALVAQGQISAEAGSEVLSGAASSHRPVAAVIADQGLVEPAVLLDELSRLSGIDAIDISQRRPAGEAFALVPEIFARELNAVGYMMESRRLVLAAAEPIDFPRQHEIAEFLGVEIAGCVLADPTALEHLMDAIYPGLAPEGGLATPNPSATTAQPARTNLVGSAPDTSPLEAVTDVYEAISLDEPQPSGATRGARVTPGSDSADWQGDYGAAPREAATPLISGGRDQDLEQFTPTLNADGTLDINELLSYAVRNGASDLHLANQLPPAIRIDGALRPIEGLPRLDNEHIREMVYRILTQGLRERFEAERELDTAHTIMGVGRFRVNVFQQRGSIGSVMRAIPHEIPPFDTLGLPEVVASLAELRRGLVLVTGPTGSGKSTTLASLVNIINKTKPLHIMTVEDPIEFLHSHNRSIVNQREVGTDTQSFSEALRHVLRQDPDVILIGEMRDNDTIATALTAAETGHLVFATLHTQDAPQTIDRIIDVFPSAQQDQIRIQLAGSLEAVVTQQLVLSASGFGRTAVAEVMICSPAIRNLIRSAKTHQIYSLIQTGAAVGMQTMDQALAKAIQTGSITEAMGFDRCHDPSELRDYLRPR
jgi:twitching motility protein PilT